jgi:hypothetical protein
MSHKITGEVTIVFTLDLLANEEPTEKQLDSVARYFASHAEIAPFPTQDFPWLLDAAVDIEDWGWNTTEEEEEEEDEE